MRTPRQVCSAHQTPVRSRTVTCVVPLIARSSPWESAIVGSPGRLTGNAFVSRPIRTTSSVHHCLTGLVEGTPDPTS